ncbi:MAG: helix-turn-helix domain-containing protein [Thermodesulfobacteriota bacterium]|nr:helix-turn-helix domain-containing protein [Thermodesulfobacteriota bacterium]
MPTKPKSKTSIPGWMRVKSAAHYIDVSERSLRNYLKEGLRHARFRGSVFVKKDWLDEFLEAFEVDHENEADRIAEDVFSDYR